MSNTGRRQLYNYLSFYREYTSIVRALPAQLQSLIPFSTKSDKKMRAVPARLCIDPKQLIQKLSYTHFEQLVTIDNPTKRLFYEIECMKGLWSSRDLKRQIASLYYERSGLSRNKKALSKLVNAGVIRSDPKLSIRDPHVFEFLGVKSKEIMSESNLEDALLDKLQDFLLELGHGFCFEARQKRILLDDEHAFVDLVFYHRILKCHILIELKICEFKIEHTGQLNTYVSWYNKNERAEGDNPPIGILLCTKKNHAKVEYALAGMNNKLFVNKYQLELPKKKEIEHFLKKQLK